MYCRALLQRMPCGHQCTSHKCFRVKIPGYVILLCITQLVRGKFRADFWGRGSDEAHFSEKKGVFSEEGGGIQ